MSFFKDTARNGPEDEEPSLPPAAPLLTRVQWRPPQTHRPEWMQMRRTPSPVRRILNFRKDHPDHDDSPWLLNYNDDRNDNDFELGLGSETDKKDISYTHIEIDEVSSTHTSGPASRLHCRWNDIASRSNRKWLTNFAIWTLGFAVMAAGAITIIVILITSHAGKSTTNGSDSSRTTPTPAAPTTTPLPAIR